MNHQQSNLIEAFVLKTATLIGALNSLTVASLCMVQTSAQAAPTAKAKKPVSPGNDFPESDTKDIGRRKAKVSSTNESSLFTNTPTAFAGLLDQAVDVRPMRVDAPTFGLTYAMIDSVVKSTTDSTSTSTKANGDGFQFLGFYPTDSGIKVGVTYINYSQRYKSDTSSITSTKKVSGMELIASAELKSGLGLTLSAQKLNETVEVSIGSLTRSIDASYGVLIPTIHYSAPGFQVLLTHTPSQRHETGETPGADEMDLEFGQESLHLLGDVKFIRSVENEPDEEYNHFSGGGGVRFMLDKKSNILAKIKMEDASYTERQYVSSGRIANQTLEVAGEHLVATQHVIGWKYSPLQASGNGSTSLGTSRKYSVSANAYALSYRWVMPSK